MEDSINKEIETASILTDDELLQVLSPDFIESIVFGFMVNPRYVGGIMLKVKDSKTNANVFFHNKDYNIRKDFIASKWCVHMRTNTELCVACEETDEKAFEIAELKSVDPNWNGFSYLCKGGLIDIAVPIRINRTKEFIGVAFHGQFRPYDTDLNETRKRLKNYRLRIAELIGVRDLIISYDSLSKNQKNLKYLKERIIGEASKNVNTQKWHIEFLFLPLEKYLRYYITAPMIRVEPEFFENENIRSFYDTSKDKIDSLLPIATLGFMDYNLVGNDGACLSTMPNILESCQKLSSRISNIVSYNSEKKIERYILNKIFSVLLGVEDVESFWNKVEIISEYISQWLDQCNYSILRIDNKRIFSNKYILSVHKSKNLNTEEIIEKLLDKEILDNLTDGEKSIDEVERITSLKRDDFVDYVHWMIPLKIKINGRLCIQGLILFNINVNKLISKVGIAIDFKDVFQNISFLLNERLTQLSTINELNKLVDDHKKALIVLTHTIHRPLVEIMSGISFIKNYKENIDESLIKVQDYIEELQIIASCLSKAFRFNIDNNMKLGNQQDLINVDEEIIRLADRMMVFRKHSYQNIPNIEFENKTNREIRTDRYTFLFVVYNLLDNAIKYSYPEKEIRIECSTENSKFCLKIKSYGDPIPIKYGEESFPFQLFWRGEEQHGYKGESYHPGLGVGLWACQVLLRKQGGDIWLIPYTPNNRNQTIFSVKFP